MEYISDWYVKLIRYSADYYKPDIIEFSDDIATQRGLLMSPASYQEMLKPYYKKCYNAILEAGCHLAIHCCGKLDDIVDDLVEMGVEYMTLSQQINDLAGIKAQYGNRLVMQGCWDSQGEPGQRGANEAVVRQAVRDCMDHYAIGGGYVFSTCYTTIPEFVGEELYSWIIDEAR